MATAPTVTVVIPTYNAAAWLGAAIDSALAQSFTDFELLVLDNASEDETPALVARYDDPRVEYRRNPENLGFVGNANLGLASARGRYLTWLGADDIWEPAFLERAVARLEADPTLAFVHGAAVWIDEHGRPFGGTNDTWAAVTPGADAFVDCFSRGFCFSTMVVRTALARAVGPLDTGWREIADSWIFLRLCLEGDVGYIHEPLVRYRVHQQSLSLALYADGALFRRHLAARARAGRGRPTARGNAPHRRRVHQDPAHHAAAVVAARVPGRPGSHPARGAGGGAAARDLGAHRLRPAAAARHTQAARHAAAALGRRLGRRPGCLRMSGRRGAH